MLMLMSAVETGQMSAVETGQMSAVETRRMSTKQTGHLWGGPRGVCSLSIRSVGESPDVKIVRQGSTLSYK